MELREQADQCQHDWNETTSNGDAYRFFVCKHCDATRNYIPLDIAESSPTYSAGDMQ